MTTKQIIKSLLERYRTNQIRIVEIDKELYDLEHDDNLGGSDFEERISSGNINTLDNCVINKIEEQSALIAERRLCVDETNTVDFLINNLDDEKRNLIILRYFDNHQWTKVVRELNISERQCHRLRVAAFSDLEKQYNWMTDFIFNVLRFRNIKN